MRLRRALALGTATLGVIALVIVVFGGGAAVTAAVTAADVVVEPPAMGAISETVASAICSSLPLSVPLENVPAAQLVDSFSDRRGTDRAHEAIDILAPRGTPVHAVDDGVVATLFLSKPGGLTLYQFDPTRTVAYYYAHLDGYADGLAAGQVLKRGDTIGYVGSTGNANPAAPHLHFAVFELGPEKQWWKGRPIDPLPLFRYAAPPAAG